MNRKTFFKKFALISGISLFRGRSVHAKSGDAKETTPETDPQASFRKDWIRSLLSNMNDTLPDSSRIQLMESCGRDCANRGSIKMAKDNQGDVDAMLSVLATHIGKENTIRDGDTITLKYSECYCPMVSKIKENLSKTWCQCSRGWVLEMFETTAGKKVDVTLVKSILAGDDECEFTIKI